MRFILLIFAIGWTGNIARAEPQIITGARTWRMADGSAQRLRFVGFTRNEQFANFQYGTKPLSAFSTEDQAVFAALKNGSLKLTTTPGLCMHPNFPNGKLDPRMTGDSPWTGETRTWQNISGKRIVARLVCLTDEDVSLLIGDSVGRVPLKDLVPADLAYLERLKGDVERNFAAKVEIGGGGWDGGPYYTISISGEKYASLAKQGSHYEEALAAVLRHVSSKLDREKWELDSFTEARTRPPGGPHSPGTLPGTPEESPYCYTAEIFLKKSAEEEARRKWPLTTSPPSWRGEPMLRIHLMADGEIIPAEPANQQP
jgi:hypothetical protein